MQAGVGHSGAHARRSAILERLKIDEHVSTTELSDQLAVSSVTIRADLEALEERGRLRRVHGGAVPATPVVETRHDARRNIDREAKQQIATAALEMIEPGMTIVLDVGTSTLALAELLAADETISGVTVVTNGLRIAGALETALPRIEVFVTGGSLRAMQHSLVNPGVSEKLDRLTPSVAFIGCDGLHAEHGVTTTNFPEADVKERMRRVSDHSVLLAAASKVGEVATVKVNEVHAFDTLLTTEGLAPAVIDQLEDLGLEVRVVPGTTTIENHGELRETA